MIKYSLICDTDHGFEAWFKSSDSFTQQLESGILSCPTCGSEAVRKALMAPSVRSTKGREIQSEPQVEVLPPEPKTPTWDVWLLLKPKSSSRRPKMPPVKLLNKRHFHPAGFAARPVCVRQKR